MDMTLHIETWHLVAGICAVIFHAGGMWVTVRMLVITVREIRSELRRIADDHEKRLRWLERQGAA